MGTSLAIRGGAPGSAVQTSPNLAWGNGRRSLWSRRRRKTLTSIAVVMTLVAGLAVAFKLYSQQVPNNVVRDASSYLFDVLTPNVDTDAMSPPAELYQQANFDNPIFKRLKLYPGDMRKRKVKIDNNRNEGNLRVTDIFVRVTDIFVCRPPQAGETVQDTPCLEANPTGQLEPGEARPSVLVQPTTDPRWKTFVGFFQIAMGGACTGVATDLRSCDRPLFTDLAAGKVSDAVDFTASELDQGDQTPYKGWAMALTFLFQAKPKPAASTPV